MARSGVSHFFRWPALERKLGYGPLKEEEYQGKDQRMTADSPMRPADPKDAADVALSQILAWQLA
jgi:hypothetical protein